MWEKDQADNGVATTLESGNLEALAVEATERTWEPGTKSAGGRSMSVASKETGNEQDQ